MRIGGCILSLLSRSLLILSLTSVSFAQVMTVPTKPAQSPATQPSTAGPQIDPTALNKVIGELRAKKFEDALTDAKAILTANPQSSKANKLVGVVLLDDEKPTEALPYFEKSLSLDANDPSVHALMLQAYAQAGDAKNRDAQRDILRTYHSDGQHPDFSRSMGFMVETIHHHDKLVQAIEFYAPMGKDHFYYRFNVFNPDGHLTSFLVLQSDEADQADYAKQHAKEAAAGGRRFSIDLYTQNEQKQTVQSVMAYLDSQPSYDDLRARVIKIVDGDSKPLSVKTLTPPTPPTAPAAPAAPASSPAPAPATPPSPK
jgi:tetratricopeptide (TPR) repeat protein